MRGALQGSASSERDSLVVARSPAPEGPNWQDGLDGRLLQRLFGRLLRPGLADPWQAERVIGRHARMSGGLPVAQRLERLWFAIKEDDTGWSPIVYPAPRPFVVDIGDQPTASKPHGSGSRARSDRSRAKPKEKQPRPLGSTPAWPGSPGSSDQGTMIVQRKPVTGGSASTLPRVRPIEVRLSAAVPNRTPGPAMPIAGTIGGEATAPLGGTGGSASTLPRVRPIEVRPSAAVPNRTPGPAMPIAGTIGGEATAPLGGTGGESRHDVVDMPSRLGGHPLSASTTANVHSSITDGRRALDSVAPLVSALERGAVLPVVAPKVARGYRLDDALALADGLASAQAERSVASKPASPSRGTDKARKAPRRRGADPSPGPDAIAAAGVPLPRFQPASDKPLPLVREQLVVQPARAIVHRHWPLPLAREAPVVLQPAHERPATLRPRHTGPAEHHTRRPGMMRARGDSDGPVVPADAVLPAPPDIDIAGIVDKVERRFARRLAIEAERRGKTRWR